MSRPNRHGNRTAILLAGQDAAPKHFAGRALAAALLSAKLGVPQPNGSVRLVPGLTWLAAKRMLRPSTNAKLVVPGIKPPLPFYPGFDPSYPRPLQTSNGRQHQARVWMEATRF